MVYELGCIDTGAGGLREGGWEGTDCVILE